MLHIKIEHTDHYSAALYAKAYYALPVNYPVVIETDGDVIANTIKRYHCYIVSRQGVRKAEDCEAYLFKAVLQTL